MTIPMITYRGHTCVRDGDGLWFNMSPSPVAGLVWACFYTMAEREALAAGEATPEDEQIAILKRGIDRAEDGVMP